MSYETALKISDVINEIHRKKYLLPAIQREFVWSTYQIERLFDSLMRDYPIGSFLFWKVEKDKTSEYEFYEFLREYHERDKKHNPKANITGDEEITAVLDGQQRLTSLYIGLKGSFAYKLPRKRWDNDQAYPRRKLFLNLVSQSKDPDFEYEFAFLTKQESEKIDEEYFWFPVGEILNYKEPGKVNSYLLQNNVFQNFNKEKADFANHALFKLHATIHNQGSISYYQEKSQLLDKVLNIFIRINSGGTVLSYSDLLLSIATAQWESKDAREEINNFVDEINNIGDGFNFNKDFVLKSCLVLSDFNDIAFKVDNFNKANMLKIENNWDRITNSIRIAVSLVASFGYNRETLTSNNAIIPIAYFLNKINAKDTYALSNKNLEKKIKIKKWLVLSLIKRAFSGQPDNVLRPIRKIIQESGKDRYPLETIISYFKGTNKTLIFSDEDIENLLYYKYGQGFTFSVLSLLYPSLDYKNLFHVDHIFPKSQFTKAKLRKKGISEDEIDTFQKYVNFLGNLQLLEATPNIEKLNKNFDLWLYETYPNENDRKDYMKKHLIPDVDLSFENFIEFFERREKMLKHEFQKILQ
ncbi:protein of unknown function DUF262 [Flexistipes sinusarabici DSM 4947]|uniref:DUF262 domain-containing protein n=1 Tax=Flexistipes sinusarabici (strain ATCC 49648 / DSM 4947 / MAS 10) TaxID=717231 RepID=F8E5B2_FLESM|nr:DUF262 domain-containing protein [Flexistipes sinusarabici]AEI14608.1 protein of unknown function DUF262 [Flexistipes sinusarabici DSM 4947]